MRHESIESVRHLIVGVFNSGSNLDRTALEACPDRFSSVKVLSEPSVHRAIRDAGISVAQILSWDTQFSNYENIKGFHLLLFAFQRDGTDYLKIINYLGRLVTTVVLDVQKPTCSDVFLAQRILSIDSLPPIADVLIDGRKIGEAPLWTFLRDGYYEVSCELPGQRFSTIGMNVPKDVFFLCRRDNTQAQPDVHETDDGMTTGEKAGSILIYLAGAAAAIAAIVLPILFIF